MPILCQDCLTLDDTERSFNQITSKHLMSAHSQVYHDIKTALSEYRKQWPDCPISDKKERKQSDIQEALDKVDDAAVKRLLEQYSDDPHQMAEDRAVKLLLKLEAIESFCTGKQERGQLIKLMRNQQVILKEFLASRANVKKPKGEPLTKADMEELTDIAARIREEVKTRDITTLDPKFMAYIERGVPLEEEDEE